MLLARDRFVADVTEDLVALFASQHILFTGLYCDLATPLSRAHRRKLNINPFCILIRMFLDDLLSHLSWQQSALVAVVLRIFFVMLLTFGSVAAVPAEVLPAPCALHVSAAALELGDWHSALRIGT